jgi:hypothetical protein
MNSKTSAIFFSFFLLIFGFAPVLNSQPANENLRQKAVMERLQKVEDRQSLLLEQQEKTLKALEVLAKNARQTRIFASRN